MSAASIQAAIYRGYGIAGTKLGSAFSLYRGSALQTPIVPANLIASLSAQFTNAKSSAFNYTKGQTYDDVLWYALVDASQTQVGDYLVGTGATYFVASMPPLLPVSCVQCNRVVTLSRPDDELGGNALPSQPGGTGKYFGPSAATAETVRVAQVPACVLGTTGRATGTGQLPSDAAGPSRWRIHLPPVTCPEGSVLNRDILTDDDGARYQVSANFWSAIGYRLEAIRLEA